MTTPLGNQIRTILSVAMTAMGAVAAYVGLAIPAYWLLDVFAPSGAVWDWFWFTYVVHLLATLVFAWVLARLLHAPLRQAVVVTAPALAVLALLLSRLPFEH